MKEADMKKKICPIMSPAPDNAFILCQGSACLAFNSRPIYEYLDKNGRTKLTAENLQTFQRDNESPELKALLSQGWERNYPQYVASSLRRSIEIDCWCDAMAGNAQCSYEAP